ncbi:MAG: sigma-70 family RNA polymerase sigma factor [Oscillospiraceae bacterium]|nr:sigma-70 family RNA polymerase sigma factor [Oscillospiraceae bacterium]
MTEITAQMINLAAKGNQTAIEDLYRLTYNSVYKSAKVLIQDEDAVLDIVQDSYVKAFQSLDQLDSPENFKAWIKRIATNKAKDYLKKKKPVLFSEMAGEDGEEIDFRDEQPDHYPEVVVDRKETARLMKEILDALSEDQRLVIGMFYYEEMSVREIAESLGCSENTVKSRLNYGRKKVEVKVRELEKKGVRLYSMAPLAFLLSLFSVEASAAEIPSQAVLEAVVAKCTTAAGMAGAAGAGVKAATGAGAKAATGAGAKAAAGAGVKTTLATKLAAGALAVAVAGGGIAAALSDSGPKMDFTREELLAFYQEACHDNCRLWDKNREDYKFLHKYTVGSFKDSDAQNIVYCDWDLDGNGAQELLIGLYNTNYNSVHLECVYTFQDGYAVEAIAEEWTNLVDKTTGDTYAEELFLTEENRIMKTWGVDAGVSKYTLWELSDDGVTMEQIGEFTEDFLNDRVTFEDQTISCHAFHMEYDSSINEQLPWKILVPHPDMPAHLREDTEVEIHYQDPRELFDPILEQYRSVVTMDSQQFLAAPENYFNGDHAAMRYYHMDHAASFFFAYRDIDRNGMEELLIGVDQGYRKAIVDLYGTDGSQVFQLLDEPTLGDRSSVMLQEDGILAFTLSDGMGGTVYEWKAIRDNALVDASATDSPEYSGLPWEPLVVDLTEKYFNELITSVRDALDVPTEEYDSRMEYFDEQYAHLGKGVMWMLMHRQAGDDTMRIWVGYLDVDEDGREELILGRGLKAKSTEPIAIYTADGSVIFGDAVWSYDCSLPPEEWGCIGG